MPSVTCPYCWHSYRSAELAHRCGTRTPCRREVFGPGQLGKDGRCPHGNQPAARRVCPNEACHKDLLREYVDGGGRPIAVIGARASGKSTWVGVLVHELRGQVADRFPGMALDLLGEESRIRYEREFDQRLFRERLTLSPTRTAQTTQVDPLIFSLKFRTRSRLLRKDRIRPVITVFYDTAGEDMLSATGTDLLAPYLGAAEGIILLIDPMQMPDVPGVIGRPAPPGREVIDQVAVLNRLTELLRESQKAAGTKQLRTPLAVALTKVDLLSNTFDEQSPLRRPSGHDGFFDDNDSIGVHEDVRAWFEKYYNTGFDRSLASNFTTFRYFGLSALGAAPDKERLSGAGVRPYRVEDPMLWLLGRFGSISVARGRT